MPCASLNAPKHPCLPARAILTFDRTFDFGEFNANSIACLQCRKTSGVLPSNSLLGSLLKFPETPVCIVRMGHKRLNFLRELSELLS